MPGVLLIDDDKDLLMIAKAYLQKAVPTLRVVTTPFPQEALRLLEKEFFDVVVSDYQMPSIDGLELLEALRSTGNDIPFIIFTGKGREEVAMQALNLGANYYLMKGGDPKSQYGELAHIINQLVMHRQTEQALQETRTRAQNYLDIASVILVVIDANETVSMINQKGCEVLGYPEEEIVGKDWFDTFLPERMRDEVRAVFVELVAGDIQPVEYFENPVKTKNDEERLIAWHNTLLKENGLIIGTLSSGEDITERKKTEDAMKSSEETFRQTFEAIPDPSYLWEQQTDGSLILTQANKAAYGITKGGVKNFIGIELNKLYEDRPEISSTVIHVLETGETKQEELLYKFHSTAEEKWLLTEYAKPAEGKVLVITKDITERKHTERKLRRSEEKYRDLVENINDVIYTIDEKGRIAYSSPRLKKLLGYDPLEIKGQLITDFLHPEDRQRALEEIQAVLSDQLEPREYRVISKSGDVRWIRTSSKPIFSENDFVGIQGVMTDITNDKKMEEEGHESEGRYRELIEKMHEGLLVDDAEGTIIFVNPRAIELLGYSDEELIGKDALLLLSPDKEKEKVRKESAKRRHGISSTFETDLRTKNGKKLSVRITASPLFSASGRFRGTIRIFTNITDRKQAEKALRASEKRYRHLFEDSPISLWEGDYSAVKQYIDNLRNSGITNFREYFHTHPKEVVKCANLPKIVAVNSSTLRLYKAESYEDFLERLGEIFSIKTLPMFKEGFITLAEGSHVFESEGITHTLDDNEVRVRIKASVAPGYEETLSRVIFAIINITEQQQTENALRESEHQYRELVQEMHECLLVEDEKGVITFVNPRTAELLGFTEDEIIGKPVLALVPESSKEIFIQETKRRRQDIRSTYEALLQKKDGQIFPVIVNAAPLYSVTGAYRGNLAVFTDITERKQVEEILRKSEERYREFFEKLHDGVLVEDVEGNIIFVNPQLAEMLEYSKEELIGKHWSYVSPPDQLARVEKENRKRRQLITSTYEANLLTKEGKTIPVIVSGSPLQTPTGTFRGTLAVFTDISNLKKTEEALRKSEQEYRELVEELHEGVLVEYNDKISFVNPRLTSLLGYAEEELIGRHWPMIVAPESLEKVQEENLKRIQGTSSTYEINLQKKDGQTVPVNVSGTPLFALSGVFRGTLAVFTDISRLKAAEQALRESESKYRAILEKMNDGYYELDLRGKFAFFNDAMCDLLGYTTEELRGMNYQEVMDKETAKAFYQVYNTLYRTREPAKPIVGPIIQKDGTSRFIETTPSLIIDETGEIVGFRGILHDTTERKQAEVQLGRQKEELSEFAHTMAHDLKNSLLSIEGYAELLETEYDAVYAKKISQIAAQMNALLRRSVILAEAGQIIEKTDEINLSDLIQFVAKTVVPENIAFISDSLPTVVGDREKLTQVFQNLFKNAVIHGRPNSIEVRYQIAREGKVIRITNDGTPIPMKYQEKIFSRGFTTKAGRGLGLTIVRKIIEAHGWQIYWDATPQTTFRIVIPADKLPFSGE